MYQLAMMISFVVVIALGFYLYHEAPLYREARRLKREKKSS
jgi:hypothetical protein